MDFCLIAFVSTHAAMEAQQYLEKEFKITAMPTLREISIGCGISLRFEVADKEKIQSKMVKSNIDPALYKLYGITFKQGKYYAEPL